ISQEGRVAIQRSWETATKDFERMRFAYEIYRNNDQKRIDQEPLPGACVDAVRTEGLDPVFGATIGLTLCASDGDAIFLIVTSGTVAELTGFAASDYVASLAL